MAANSEGVHVILTILLFFFISAVNCGKLNAPKVLLPYSRSVSTNFTLEVTNGGCFYWSISRPEIVKLSVLQPDEKGCSSRAIVYAVASQASQQSALVTLRQEATREVIQCEVMVSAINSMQILTTSRELLLEDTPEMFTLIASTKEGDTFSTLEGLTFQWNLITDKETVDVVNADDILRFVKFRDSQYEAPPGIKHMEAHGRMGHVALVEGIKTGTAKVSAALVDDSYNASISVEVTLAVVANMVLSPEYEVHALVGSVWHYDVQHVQYGIVRNIEMPSEQFYLKISDDQIVSLDSQTSNVKALALGHTTIVLHDKNIKNRHTFRQTVAGIRVVKPHHIEFVIEPYNNWFLVSGYNYTITVKIFDRDGVEILATDNLRVETTLANNIEAVLSSANGTWHFVKGGHVGTFQLKARVDSMIGKNGLHTAIVPELVTIKEGEVLDAIEVVPAVVVVPWDLTTRTQYQIQLTANGGGNYGHVWSSSNTSLVDCDHKGKITTKSEGSALVFAASSRNRNIFDSAQILITTPDRMAVLECSVEIEVGKILHLPLALFTNNKLIESEASFSDCTNLPFVVQTDDVTRLQYLNGNTYNPKFGGCAILNLLAVEVGFVEVTVELPVYPKLNKVSVIVAVYKPLKHLNPTAEIVLPLASLLHVAYEGGPRPWILKPRGYFENVSAKEGSIVIVEQLLSASDRKNDDLHIYTVLCTSLGETETVLKVGNLKSENNVKPVVVVANLRIVCAKPASMELVALVRKPSSASTPCMLDPGYAVAQCYNPLQIMVVVKDSKGRVFGNVTSLHFQWHVSDKSLATFISSEKSVQHHEEHSRGFPMIIKSYQVLKPANVEGRVRITCYLKSYVRDTLSVHGMRSDLDIEPEISQSLQVDLVDDGIFTSDKIFMFDHPSSTSSIKITRGSGIFDFAPRDHPAAIVTFDDKTSTFEIAPNQEGSFILTAIDRCLESREEATLNVRVVGIHAVNVKMLDKVELGKEITASVTVLDDEQRPFAGSVMSLLDIVPQISSGVISISNYSRTNVSGHSVTTFSVNAVALGHATVIFSVSRKGIDREPSIFSGALPVQVFSPLKIHPANITLVFGAKFQVLCVGGPQPTSTIEYLVANSHVASVSGSGIVEAIHIGHTTITAYAVSIDSQSGFKNLHSKDEVTVYVVTLSGIHIRAPLTRWSVGSFVPVFAVGSNDNETPFAFGSAVPPLSFSWSISNKEVVRILPVYHATSVQLAEENDFAVRLLAKQSGQVTLKLHVGVLKPSPSPNYQITDNMALVDEIQLQVFENINMMKPQAVIDHLLISPKSSMRLATNKDQVAAVTYRVQRETVPKNGSVPCIVVDKVGNMRSDATSCSGTVMIESRDDAGLVQSISLLVNVKSVSYLMVSPVPLVLTPSSTVITSIPLGAHFKLRVSLHDNTGKEFGNTACKIKFRPSRFDLVEVTLGADNYTLTVRANNPGVTVLRVWDADFPKLEDFIPIVSGDAITPSGPIFYLGDRICFTSPLVTSLGTSGKWSSDNEAVLRITKRGYAIATDVGTGVVFYTISDTVTTSTEVNVVPMTAVNVLSSDTGSALLTNAHPGKVYHVPVIISGPEIKKESHALRSEYDCATGEAENFVPFECHLKFKNSGTEIKIEDVFQISAVFTKGVPECLVTTLPTSDTIVRQLSGVKSDMEIYVTVPERRKQSSVTSNKINLPFAAAFHVQTSELNLTDIHPMSSLIFSATNVILDSLQVLAKESSLLEFLPMSEKVHGGSYEPRSMEIPVQLSQDFWRSAKVFDEINSKIEIMSLLTKQIVTVPVHIKIVGDDTGRCAAVESRTGWMGLMKAMIESSKNWIIIILSIVGTIIAIFIGYHALVGQRYTADVSQSAAYLNSAGFDRSQTSWIGSPRMTSSPTTDHRFLWSTSFPQKRSP